MRIDSSSYTGVHLSLPGTDVLSIQLWNLKVKILSSEVMSVMGAAQCNVG